MSYLTELLDSTHLKSEFDCGQELLDSYLHRQASQDLKRHIAVCLVITDESHSVKGYYTLSNASIDRELIPDDIKNKLPKSYADMPVTLLGRLARDKSSNGETLGETLLLDALKRCYDTSLTVASMAVVVVPIDETAKNFYLKYGFFELHDSGKMFMTIKAISALF